MFSSPSSKAQTLEPVDKSSSGSNSQKFSAAAVTDDTQTSGYEWKNAEYSNGTAVTHVNGEGPARQRVF